MRPLMRRSVMRSISCSPKRSRSTARGREKCAQEDYDNLVAGKPLPRESEQGLSKRQPSLQAAVRSGEGPRPMTSEEVQEVRERNQWVKQRNTEIAGMTPAQRLEKKPDVAKRLSKAQQGKKDAQETLEDLIEDGGDTATGPSGAPFDSSDVRFSDGEIEILREFVPKYFRAIGRAPSPRSIKAFLFKLQLSRLLMQLRYPALDDGEQRMKELLGAFLNEANAEKRDRKDPYAVVVRQVL
jgi:hypothetical protein